MHRCERCGGLVQDQIPACPYCGAITPFGAQVQSAAAMTSHARAQQELAQEQKRHAQAMTALARTAWASLIVSVLGLVTCCLPLASLLAIALGLRAAFVARKHKLTLPAAGVVGILLGVVGIVSAVGFWIFFGVDQYYEEQLKRELWRRIGNGDTAQVLAQPTACAMAELELLETSHRGYTRSHEVRCHGKLTVTGETAVLHDLMVRGSGDSYRAFVCFKRGAKWMVAEIRADAACGSEPATTTASATASAVPSASASR
jgi:hypothetical protein